MNWTQSEAIAILAAFTIGGFLTGAYVLWQQGKDLGWMYDQNGKLRADTDALRDRLDEVIYYLWDLIDEDVPDGGPPTEEHAAVVDDEPDEPDTVVSHPADLGARMLALLHRAETTAGRHRAENGGPSVDQVSDGIETRMLPAVTPADGERMAR